MQFIELFKSTTTD